MLLNYRLIKAPTLKHFAKPILILHGLLGNNNNWTTISNTLALKTERPIIGVDIRNHGLSQGNFLEEKKMPLKMTWPLLIDDIFDTLSDYRHKYCVKNDALDVDIIGHSFGGLLSLQMLRNASDLPSLPKGIKVSTLICVDICPRRDILTFSRLSHSILKASIILEDQNLLTPFKKSDARNFLTQELKKDPLIADKAIMISNFIISTNWGPIRDSSNARNGFLIPLQFISLEAFPSLLKEFPKDPVEWYSFPHNQKIHFIKGSLSNYISSLDEIREYIPHATMTTIPNCGHFLHHEQGEKFIADVTENFY